MRLEKACAMHNTSYVSIKKEKKMKAKYLSTETYVVGNQKNRLIETVLLSIHNKFKKWCIRKKKKKNMSKLL